jgi:predicted DNA-binding transcriptional regulator YafY
VVKAGCWYVVAGPGPRTYRVDRIQALEVGDDVFTPPEDFDLAGYWKHQQAEFHASRTQVDAAATDAGPPPGWLRTELPSDRLPS